MKIKYTNIDNLFKQKFEDFNPEPPDYIWNNVRANIPVYPKSNFFNNSGTKAIASVIVIIAVLIAGYFIFKPSDSSTTPENIKTTTQQIKTPVNSNNNQNQDVEIIITEDSDITENNSKDDNFSKNKINQNQQQNQADTQKNLNETLTLNNKNSSKSTTEIDELTNEDVLSEKDNLKITKNDNEASVDETDMQLTPETEKVIPSKSSDIIIQDNEIPDSHQDIKNFKSKSKNKPYFLFGAYFTPEIIFYPDDSVPNNRSYNFDLGAICNFSNYFIQSGLGISFSNDDGKYTIDYEKFDYIGSYQDVYNVTFDTTGTEIIPIFHTKTVDVYDSVRHIYISKTKNTYTYLQIPLLFGYKFNRNKITYSVKAGPSLSILLSKKIPGANLQDEYIRIISIDEKMPVRVQTNWQFMLSFGFAYQYSDKLSFAIEPTMRYYIKSAYEGKYITTKHPFSAGLRAGMIFKF